MAATKAGAAQTPGGDDVREVVVQMYQKQPKLYPRSVSGLFARWRWALVWLTQLVFYGLPWLPWNDRQAVLFDLGSRRFYIFNLVLYPQDFIFLTGLLIISAYALFLFTAVAGRLWCGYACPQTVYTEIFMWIERKLEGDRMQRIKLDAAPWSAQKVLRKSGKQIIWLALGLWTGFTFVGYFTPIHTLWDSAIHLDLGPWEWFWTLFYGFATYGNAGFMREQVCKYMCPYARFQSVMFDRDTLVISYDAERGEPRGTRGRKTDLKEARLGHCIDCELCVQVCPTGIDIRKGLQYECIGCAACIDVCDGVMDKMHYPRGLVRYDTLNGLDQHLGRKDEVRRILRPRVLVYSAVLLIICAAWLAGLTLRSPFKVNVVRDRGVLARVVEDGWVENVYRLQIMNATEQPQRYRVAVSGLPQMSHDLRGEVSLAPAEARWVALAVRVPPEVAASGASGSHAMAFEVGLVGESADAPAVQVVEKSTFVLPR